MMIQEKTNGWERLKWLVTVPVVMGAMLVFAQPEVKDTLEEIAPTVDQQDTKAEIASLKKFFDERLKASEKKEPDGTVKVRERTVHFLLLNANNEVSYIKSNKKTQVEIPLEESYQTAIANLLREARAKDKQESGKDEPHTIYIRHHKEASDESILHLLKEAKAAFDILRSEYKEQGTSDIESVCPYRLYMEDINGIEVRILDENGKALLTVKDIKDVNQLKIALDRLPADKRKIAHVSIKANKDTPMEEITAVKQVLREYHILQLNMEVNKTIDNGEGTVYQQQTTTQKKE
jgi:biopolymer transport protein ExbD